MKNRKFPSLLIVTVIAVLLANSFSCETDEGFVCTNLRIGYLTEPKYVNKAEVRFSWEIESIQPEFSQYGYEILMGTSSSKLIKGKADTWRSELIHSSETNQIKYKGPSLASNTIYYWKVRTLNQDEKAGKWSSLASFRTGYDKSELKAKWTPTVSEEGDFKCSNPILNKLFAQTAIYNHDVSTFYTKWRQSWPDAELIIPFRLFDSSGDERVITKHYTSMKKYVDSIYNDYHKNGDEIPRPLLTTAFFIRSTRLLAKAAKITEQSEDQTLYTDLSNKILGEFQDEFLKDNGIITGETQAAYAIALSFDLIPKSMIMQVRHKLVRSVEANDNKMSTDLISTIDMLDELSKMGYHELACQLVESSEPASWDNTFGLVGEWMFKHILGISRDEKTPGWRHFYLEPKMGGTLTYAKGHYNSINGMISMEWKLQKNIVDLEFEIPANTTATFIMPQGHLTEVHIDDEKLISIPPDRQVKLKSGVHKVHMISR